MSLIEWLDSEHEVAAIDDLQQKKNWAHTPKRATLDAHTYNYRMTKQLVP